MSPTISVGTSPTALVNPGATAWAHSEGPRAWGTYMAENLGKKNPPSQEHGIHRASEMLLQSSQGTVTLLHTPPPLNKLFKDQDFLQR